MPLRWTRELLDLEKECDLQAYRSSGPGGQKKNKTESSVRAIHRSTGIVRIATESRSQSANRLRALDRIREAIEQRRQKPARRIPTKPPAHAKEERLKEKAKKSGIKRTRVNPTTHDGNGD